MKVWKVIDGQDPAVSCTGNCCRTFRWDSDLCCWRRKRQVERVRLPKLVLTHIMYLLYTSIIQYIYVNITTGRLWYKKTERNHPNYAISCHILLFLYQTSPKAHSFSLQWSPSPWHSLYLRRRCSRKGHDLMPWLTFHESSWLVYWGFS